MRKLVLAVLLAGACGAEPLESETSELTWTFANNCLYPMHVRLFDRDATALGETRVLTERTETLRIRCTLGEQVTFGAATEGFPGELGAGLDGTASCSNCLAVCGYGLPSQSVLECP